MNEKIEILHELCEALMRELEDVNEKLRTSGGSMSAGDLELVDKLSHALKSIKTTIAMMEADDDDDGGYSSRNMPWYGVVSRHGGRSYARGQRRDSMGRYSRDRGYSYADSIDGLLDEMRGMMGQLPEEKRRKAERLISELSV